MLASLWQPADVAMQRINSMGEKFHETFDGLPFLKAMYFSQELDYTHGHEQAIWTAENWWLPIGALLLYAFVVFAGPRIMKDREAFDLKTPLILWNLGLALFSAMGASRTVPQLLYNLSAFSFDDTVCNTPRIMYGNGACGIWTYLFIYSKIPELVDTVFIVLRKRKLIFLHWYHHITVLLYCWHAYSTQAASGLYFVAMNYSVHAVMYGYYFLAASKMVPKWFPTGLITLAQISQMFVGTGICIATFMFSRTRTCDNDAANQAAGALMYASYLYLFVAFAIERYIVKPQQKKMKKV